MSTAKSATILMALLGAFGVAAGFALAKSGPPTPTITSHPVNPTASTSATFSFTDPQPRATFLCSLDGSSFSACSSPKAYSGLAQGPHTFRVEGKDTSGKASDSASFSWTIDLAPPSIAVAFPGNAGSYNAANWGAGCTGRAGVCGSATDPSGVSTVVASIKQNATGRYWNGSGFTSPTELYNNAGLSHATAGATWFYAIPPPSPDGQYTLHVRATDGLGNSTPASSTTTSAFTVDTAPPPGPTITAKPPSLSNSDNAGFSFSDTEPGVTFLCKLDGGQFSPCLSSRSYSDLSDGSHAFQVEARDAASNTSSPALWSWTVDTKPPPQPKITQHPTDTTRSSSVTFAFTDSEPGGAFQCQLDKAPWATCTSPTTYTGLGARQHDFYVRAVDAAGNHSASAHFEFDVTQQTGQPFTISGNAPALLYPGAAAVAIPVKLTNPNSVPIYVTSLVVSLRSTGAASCSTSWFQITQSSIPASGVQVPANGSVTLPAQSVGAPSIRMIDSGSNQNACASAKLTLGYTGNAHS